MSSEDTALVASRETELAPVLPSESELGRIKEIITTMGKLVGTDAMPKHIKSPEAAFAVMLKGLELHMPPMYALQQVYLVNGKAAIQTEAMLALVARSGKVKWEVLENSDQLATVRITRHDTGAEFTYTYTMAMAQRAGLAGGNVWKAYPDVMLYNRAMSTALRRACPDLIGGVYTPEELGFDEQRGPRVLSLEEIEQRVEGEEDGGDVQDADFEEAPEEKKPLEVPLSPAEKMEEAARAVKGALEAMEAGNDALIVEEAIATSANVTEVLKAIGIPNNAIRAVKENAGRNVWPEGAPEKFTPEDHQKLWGYVRGAWTSGSLAMLLYVALCEAQGLGADEIEIPDGLLPAPANEEPSELPLG